MLHPFPGVVGLLLLGSSVGHAAGTAPDPAANLERAVAAAEASLRQGDLAAAEGQYHTALAEAWQLTGRLATPEGVAILERLAGRSPKDLELAFALAVGSLGSKKVERAASLFADIARERPIPQTHLLIARAWRDHGEFGRARTELRAALARDPRARRAHYELGMVALREGGRLGVDEAIAEFEAELGIAPDDPQASLELGVALVQRQRYAEALPRLEGAARSAPPQARAFAYLGRARLGLDRPADAAAALTRALELATAQGANRAALLAIHLHLGQALRRVGREADAEAHFAESKRMSAAGTDDEREQLARYLADPAEPEADHTHALPAAERLALQRRVTSALARSYLNLGVLQAQGDRFEAAAELFENAAAVDPDFPQVQSSLGVAYFNARRFDAATGPLSRAVAQAPADPGLTRMLAMAWLNAGDFARAADLLRDDPLLASDPALQFAYGLSLVKSDRAAEAEPIFARLLAVHGDSAELSVLVGQAHAQQGDFEAAVTALQRALRLKAGVAEANATLGVIYFRQGRFPEAEQALRAELAAHPADLRSRHNLALVLESQQQPEEALTLLRSIVKEKPDTADARYLMGRILLARGVAAEAAGHLEAAARLAPEDASIRYQLGQAYQKLGRTEMAQQQFDVFRQLKDKAKVESP